jgi:hypothetical protein
VTSRSHGRPAREAQHLAEAEAALPSLATPCLVLFDDSSCAGKTDGACVPVFGGKGARAVPFLVERSFRVERHDGGQVLLSRRAEV